MTYDKKKWLMISATIVAVLIVIWQVRAMVNSDFVPAKPAKRHLIQHVQATPRSRPVSVTSSSGGDSGKTALYVRLAKEIELAKMQRQLLEERVAIAKAEQRLAAMHSVAAPMTSITTSPRSVLSSEAHRYKLLALSNQANKGWQAMLEVDGQLMAVRIGQQLPNGDEVIHMSHDQVWIDQHNKAIALSFEGIQALSMRSVDMARKAAHVTQAQEKSKPSVHQNHVVTKSPSAVKASFGEQNGTHAQAQQNVETHTLAIPIPKDTKLTELKDQSSKAKHVTVSLESSTPAWMNPVTYLT